MIQQGFLKKLDEYHIPHPPTLLAKDGYTRWGKNNRYSTRELGNGYYFRDWNEDLAFSWFPNDQHSLTSEQKQARQRDIDKAIRESEMERQKGYEEAAKRASSIWEKSSPNGNSPYLNKKKVKDYCIRYNNDRVIVPMYDTEGKLWSLQTINADGKDKRFLPGGRKKGLFFTLGSLSEAEKIFICEGYATAASIYEAMQIPTVIAFDAGNIEPVIAAIRSRWPNKLITICADNDQWGERNTGKDCADKAAEKHKNCKVVLPDFSKLVLTEVPKEEQKPTDFNDLHCLAGIESVREQLLEAPQAVEVDEDEEALNRLASLTPLEYDRIRKQEAERLGITVSTLDKEVKQKRPKHTKPTEDKEELFPDEEDAWPNPVVPADLLDDLANTFKRFVVLPTHADTALALWTVFTWCIDGMEVAPILAICSPEKQCGKTTLIALLTKLVSRALPTSNISPPAIFRIVEAHHPTLLIDEADTFLHGADELRGILNSGHTRPTAHVIRTVGDNHEPKRFSTWGAKTIALIGKLPDTLHDRSIVVQLRRKLPGERAEKLKYVPDETFIALRGKLKRFAQDNSESLRDARPLLPNDISDRAADNWEPLLAIAQLAGQEWEAKALRAAGALSARVLDANTISTELLADIKNIFTINPYDESDKISTADLIEELGKDKEKAWTTYNRGNPISPKQVAKILKGYDIYSKNIRIGSNISKGFERDQFEDAWSRYLPNTPPILSATRYNPVNLMVTA